MSRGGVKASLEPLVQEGVTSSPGSSVLHSCHPSSPTWAPGLRAWHLLVLEEGGAASWSLLGLLCSVFLGDFEGHPIE